MSEHEHSEDCGCDHEAIVKLLFDDRMAGPPDQKLASLDRTIEQFGALQGLADRRLVARALFSKAEQLSRLGRHGDAVGACAELERRAQDDQDVDVQVWLGSALAGMAHSFAQLWMPDRARDVLRRAAARFRGAADARVRVFAPRALCDESVTAREAGDVDASVAAASEAWEVFGRDADTDVRIWAANALNAGAFAELKADRLAGACRAYDLLYRTLGDDPDGRLRCIAVSAHFEEALVFHKTDRQRQAKDMYADLVERYLADDAVAEPVVKSMVNLGKVLRDEGPKREAVSLYERLDARFGVFTTPNIARWAAAALRNKALALAEMGRHQESNAALRMLINRYHWLNDDGVQKQVRAAQRDLVPQIGQRR